LPAIFDISRPVAKKEKDMSGPLVFFGDTQTSQRQQNIRDLFLDFENRHGADLVWM
jgi:hypothetical protein